MLALAVGRHPGSDRLETAAMSMEREKLMVTASRPYTYADLFAWPPDGDDRIYDLLGGNWLCVMRRTSITGSS
jgi:hypothetical protein